MAYCYDNFTGRYYTCNSTWNNWGRWVLLAVVIVVFLLAFFLCSCFTARRRRRSGQQPFYGTGWAAGKPPAGHAPATYNGGWGGNQQPQQEPYYSNPEHGQAAPPYSPPANQTYYGGQNQSYYDQNIELQQPSTSYQPQRGGDPVYEPPTGPPPGKQGDGIIR